MVSSLWSCKGCESSRSRTESAGVGSYRSEKESGALFSEDGKEGAIESVLVPLLDDSEGCDAARDRVSTGNKRQGGASSIGGTTFNICNTIVGAGIMALPYQVATLGVVLGLVYNLFLAFILYLSTTAIIRASDRSGHRTYTDVIRGELGKGMGYFVQWCIILVNAGCLAVYLIIIGDVLVGSPGFEGIVPKFALFLGASEQHSLFTSRWLVVLLVTILFLLPLVSCKNLSGLVHASTLAILLVVGFALVVVGLFIAAAQDGTLAHVSWGPNAQLAGSTAGMVAVTLIAALPTIIPAYIAHMNIPPLMGELRGYSQERMVFSARLSFVICLVLYLVISIGAYFVFGEDTQADILLNFTPGSLSKIIGGVASEVVGTAVAFFYVSKLILVFPLVNWALRENLSDLFFGVSRPQGWQFYAVTYSILVVSYVLAILVGSIEIAMDFIGCTTAMSISMLAPAMLLARYEWSNWKSATVAIICFFLSGLMLIMGNAKIASQLFHI